MRNPDWNAEAFAAQLAVHTVELHAVDKFVEDLSVKLLNPDHSYHFYAIDHADEQLKAAAKQLHAVAERLNRLRAYTNYPSAEFRVGYVPDPAAVQLVEHTDGEASS